MLDSTKVLLPEGQKVLNLLQKISLQDFYLAGGTGLALQFGHRISLDFDFFSKKITLDRADRQSMQALFERHHAQLKVEKEKEQTLILRVWNVRVSFFHYPYPLIRPVVQLNHLFVASIWDIGAMKLSALINRGSRRDFIDLYEIAQRIPLEDLLEKSAKKYCRTLDFPFQALKALAYFEEAEIEPLPRLLKPAGWEEVRSFFEKSVRKLSSHWLKKGKLGGFK